MLYDWGNSPYRASRCIIVPVADAGEDEYKRHTGSGLSAIVSWLDMSKHTL